MMGGIKVQHDCIKAFSETDFTDDLKSIDVPALVMHGEDDQIVPSADAGPLSAKLLKNATTRFYLGFPHGMPTTHTDVVNPDLLVPAVRIEKSCRLIYPPPLLSQADRLFCGLKVRRQFTKKLPPRKPKLNPPQRMKHHFC
jgi:hypothetical protein